jgi:hypothetical protein
MVKNMLMVACAFALLNAFASFAMAQPPVPRLSSVFPAGAQRGTTLEVTAFGDQLATTFGLWVSGGGIKGEIVKAENNRVQLKLTVEPDALVGERDLRLVTKGGVSNRVRFIVGVLPEINETEPNNNLSQAQSIQTLPVVVNGTLNPGEDVDYFRLSLKAGQTITVDMFAQRLFPYLPSGGGQPGYLDGVITLLDSNGRELTFCDDVFLRPDPAIKFTAPADGEYVLKVHDISYRGSVQFVYRLVIGSLPVVTHYAPLGWQGNTNVRLLIFGLLLNGPSFLDAFVPLAPSQSVTVPPQLRLPTPLASLPADGQLLAPIRLVSVPFPTTWETEHNDIPEQANRITPPVGVNGTFYRSGDLDCFAFSAQRQQRFIMETWAWRLGSPVDTVLEVLNAQGQVIASNDDHPDGLKRPDSYLEWTAPVDGEFFLRVKNRLNNGGNDFAYSYFLIVRPFQPDFEVRVTDDNPRVPQGGTVAIPIFVVRREGFNGEVTVTVVDLPSGWQVRPLVLPPNRNEGVLTVTVPNDTPLGAYPIHFHGTALIGEKTVTREGVGFETVQYVDQQRQDVVKAVVIGVIEPFPLRLSTPDLVEGQAGSSVIIPVRVERSGEFKGPVQISVQYLPPNSKADPVTIGEDQTEGELTVQLQSNTPAGTYTLLVQGQAKVGDRNLTVIAPAVKLTVKPAPSS